MTSSQFAASEKVEARSQWMQSTKASLMKLKPEKISQKRQVYGYTHAMIMLICFGVVLATIYSQQEPSRYTTSYTALKNAVNVDMAEAVVTRNDIWAWFRVLIRGIGGKTIDHIRINCQYNVPFTQNVTLEGKRENTTHCTVPSISSILAMSPVWLISMS